MKYRLLAFAVWAGAVWAQSELPGAALSRAIREAGLDPEQCYAVRDLAFSRDEIKLFFNHGHLIFSKPVAGERLTVVFATADEDSADGELLLRPPGRDERQSLAKFTGSPNLDEHFQTALLSFTDGSAAKLIAEIGAAGRGQLDREACQVLATRWDPTVSAMNESLTQRMVGDLLSPVRPGGGFLFVAMENQRYGTFDAIFDPLADDQILVGQLAPHGGFLSYDVWTSFPSREIRQGGEPHQPGYTISSYQIAASLDDALHLKASTRIGFQVGGSADRVLTFGLSRAERVLSAKLDGRPVEVVNQDSERTRALRADENDLFLIVAPDLLAPGGSHEVEIEHEGDVIVDKGNGVYTVNARANWYPRIATEFAAYDIEFRYPSDLTLVSAGEVVDDRADGEFRITRRRTQEPVRVAGFNLGAYARTSLQLENMTVDVYGYRGLDPALAPRPRATIVPQPVRPLYRGGSVLPAPAATTVIQTPTAPDPRGRMDAVARDVSESLQFFTAMFGPPALQTLTVSPIPGTQGQGFPGLIYLSTLSYIEEAQRPENARDARQRVFFSDLMVAHEVAHQWWGNVVAPRTYRDEWISEALAHYSALMWIEKKRGTSAMQAELAEFRLDLLGDGGDGKTVESFGPLTWGYRLEAARHPETWRAITYEKGAWVIHMLRQRMGDERFRALLAQLRQRYQHKGVTTLELQTLVKEIAARRAAADQPAPVTAEAIDGFFDSWIRSTGIPAVRVRQSSTGRPPSVRVSGTLTYEDSAKRGVYEDFFAELPLDIQLPNGVRRTEWVRSGDKPEPFSFTLPQVPLRVNVAEGMTLATSK